MCALVCNLTCSVCFLHWYVTCSVGLFLVRACNFICSVYLHTMYHIKDLKLPAHVYFEFPELYLLHCVVLDGIVQPVSRKLQKYVMLNDILLPPIYVYLFSLQLKCERTKI